MQPSRPLTTEGCRKFYVSGDGRDPAVQCSWLKSIDGQQGQTSWVEVTSLEDQFRLFWLFLLSWPSPLASRLSCWRIFLCASGNVNKHRKDVDSWVCQKTWSNYCRAVVDPSVQMSSILLLHFISLLAGSADHFCHVSSCRALYYYSCTFVHGLGPLHGRGSIGVSDKLLIISLHKTW